MGAKGHVPAISMPEFEKLLHDWGFDLEAGPGSSGKLTYHGPNGGTLHVHQAPGRKVLNHNHGLIREGARMVGVSVREFMRRDFDAVVRHLPIGAEVMAIQRKIERPATGLQAIDAANEKVAEYGGWDNITDRYVNGALKPPEFDGDGDAPQEEEDMGTERTHHRPEGQEGTTPGALVLLFLQEHPGEWYSTKAIAEATGLLRSQVNSAAFTLANKKVIKGGSQQGYKGLYLYDLPREGEEFPPIPSDREPEVRDMPEPEPEPIPGLESVQPVLLRKDLAELERRTAVQAVPDPVPSETVRPAMRAMPDVRGADAEQAINDILSFYGDRTVIHHDEQQTILLDAQGNLWRVQRQRYVPG